MGFECDSMPFRIIPAYAGSTTPLTSRRPSRPDHPRIRGEHPSRRSTRSASMGSSPHTRGAQVGRIPPHVAPGIIPAYAGSTTPLTSRRPSRPDHPRIRGEHVGLAWEGVKLVGSSPHTRGAQPASCDRGDGPGIIPAYAGSTFNRIFPALPKADHPRIRGEHADGALTQMSIGGSSPHTRGARRSWYPGSI